MMREQNETRHKRTGIVGHASCEPEPISCSKWAQLGSYKVASCKDFQLQN